MIAQDDPPLVAKRANQALALLVVVRDALIAQIDGDPVVIARRVLLDRLDVGIGQGGDRGRVRRMDMEDAARLRDGGVDVTVNAPRGRIGRVRAIHRVLVVGVEQQQLARLDPREMPPSGVHEELLAVGRDGQAEVVCHGLVPAQVGGQPEGGRQVDPQRPLDSVGRSALAQAGYRGHAPSSADAPLYYRRRRPRQPLAAPVVS